MDTLLTRLAWGGWEKEERKKVSGIEEEEEERAPVSLCDPLTQAFFFFLLSATHTGLIYIYKKKGQKPPGERAQIFVYTAGLKKKKKKKRRSRFASLSLLITFIRIVCRPRLTAGQQHKNAPYHCPYWARRESDDWGGLGVHAVSIRRPGGGGGGGEGVRTLVDSPRRKEDGRTRQSFCLSPSKRVCFFLFFLFFFWLLVCEMHNGSKSHGRTLPTQGFAL